MDIDMFYFNRGFLTLLIFLVYFRSYGNAQAPSNRYGENRTIDTLGIPISPEQFDSLASVILIKFQSFDDSKSLKDDIIFIRLINTIHFEKLIDISNKYDSLNDLFFKKYLNKIVIITDAQISIGMSYYSKKYDLQIGGKKTKNNFYRIIH
jgi:hypothetical protein